MERGLYHPGVRDAETCLSALVTLNHGRGDEVRLKMGERRRLSAREPIIGAPMVGRSM